MLTLVTWLAGYAVCFGLCRAEFIATFPTLHRGDEWDQTWSDRTFFALSLLVCWPLWLIWHAWTQRGHVFRHGWRL